MLEIDVFTVERGGYDEAARFVSGNWGGNEGGGGRRRRMKRKEGSQICPQRTFSILFFLFTKPPSPPQYPCLCPSFPSPRSNPYFSFPSITTPCPVFSLLQISGCKAREDGGGKMRGCWLVGGGAWIGECGDLVRCREGEEGREFECGTEWGNGGTR